MRVAIFLPLRSAGVSTPDFLLAATSISFAERLKSATMRGFSPRRAASRVGLWVVVQKLALPLSAASSARRPAVNLATVTSSPFGAHSFAASAT